MITVKKSLQCHFMDHRSITIHGDFCINVYFLVIDWVYTALCGRPTQIVKHVTINTWKAGFTHSPRTSSSPPASRWRYDSHSSFSSMPDPFSWWNFLFVICLLSQDSDGCPRYMVPLFYDLEKLCLIHCLGTPSWSFLWSSMLGCLCLPYFLPNIFVSHHFHYIKNKKFALGAYKNSKKV